MTTTYWLSGYYFILQTSKFFFISATAMTLGQGHRKVIQFIFTDLYFLCLKHLRFISYSLMWEAKVIVVVAAETNWKHKVMPDWGDLIKF